MLNLWAVFQIIVNPQNLFYVILLHLTLYTPKLSVHPFFSFSWAQHHISALHYIDEEFVFNNKLFFQIYFNLYVFFALVEKVIFSFSTNLQDYNRSKNEPRDMINIVQPVQSMSKMV